MTLLAIPAIDLRQGHCVHLVRGGPAGARARIADPVSLFREFERTGFTRMHIVDLDSAAGSGTNDVLIREAARSVRADLQVGGGVRDASGVLEMLDMGARWAVLAARAVPQLDQIAELAGGFPDEIVLSISVSGRRVEADVPRSLPVDILDLVAELRGLELAGLLVRALDREGRLEGPDLRLIEEIVEEADQAVLAAGGIGSLVHLRNLEDRGAQGVIIGTAFHVGLLSPARVAAEYAS